MLLPAAIMAQGIDLPGLKPGTAGKKEPVTASLVSEHSSIAPGGTFRVAVKLQHAPTYHTYGKTLPPDATGLPTTIDWKLPEGWKAEDLPWPPTHETESTGGTKTQGYSDTVYLPARLTAPAGIKPGEQVKLEGEVKALVCDPQTCQPTTLQISLTLPVADAAVTDAAQASVFAAAASAGDSTSTTPEKSNATNGTTPTESKASDGTSFSDMSVGDIFKQLLFAFLGGLILNIMPCVFPVLGIKVTSIVHQSGEDPRRVLAHGLAYTFGILISFWVLVAVLQGLRAAGEQLAWGFQLQSPWFSFIVVLIIFIFGLNMAGVFEVGTSTTGVGMELTGKSGLKGSFFTGLLATLVATPCAAPFLAGALTFALGLSLWPSLVFFTVIALGLAFPFLVLAFFPRLLRVLPRPGAWMESFKQAMAFLMLAAAAYFTWSLMGLIGEYSQRDLLIGLVFIAAACWIYGRWFTPDKPAKTRVKAIIFTVLVFVFGFWMAYPRPKDGMWKEWSPELVDDLRAKNVPVFVDFTARWCATCQANKWVYKNQALQADFRKYGVELLRADWTTPDVRIEDALALLKKSAIPVNVLYIPGQKDPVIIDPDVPYTPSLVREALAKLEHAPKPIKGDKAQASLDWKTWAPEAVDELRSKKVPVFVEFTAQWAAAAQQEQHVYKDRSLQHEFRKHEVEVLRADWTQPDPRIEQALAKLKVTYVPLRLLYVPGQNKPIKLNPDMPLTASLVKEALAKLEHTPMPAKGETAQVIQ
ncbi:thioredoxin family protein [Roseimicrobium gellanilyticum]|nr:thioredoxin family protein [Roseimicrobium gellanilyticum]